MTQAPSSTSPGALSGIRVLDFGHVWAGPYCSATLADLGAEVIKVESSRRLDVHRRQGPYPDGIPGPDRSGVWNAQNRGKRSVTLNLAEPRGQSLARDLVAVSDVVVENFSPGVMSRLGLGFDDLRHVREDLVMMSMSAFGQCGPQRSYVGYGPSLDAWAGLDSLTTYPGGPPQALGGMFPDTASALFAATAVIGALLRRDVTGQGAYLDLSELEVSALLVGEVVVQSGAEGRDAACCHDAAAAVEDVAVLTADRRWVMLTLTPDQARELCSSEEADLQRWASNLDSRHVLAAAAERRIPAGPVQDAREVLEDSQLASRGFFRCLPHPHTPDLPVYGPIWQLSGTPALTRRAAPILGEGNEELLTGLLGLSAEDVSALAADGVVV